jgi:hypothetical protein
MYESLKSVNSSTVKAANGVLSTEENQLLDTTLAEIKGLSEKKLKNTFLELKKIFVGKR